MELTTEIMDNIYNAECSMGYKEFYECFAEEKEKYGDKMGLAHHLFGKFVGYEHSLSTLYGRLDLENRKKLVKYLNERYE